jgi:hypothetical protein
VLPLLITVLATAYFVVPDLLARYILGFFLVRKAMNAPKGEELMRGAIWAIVPLTVAWYSRHLVAFRVPDTSFQSIKNVLAALYSDKSFQVDGFVDSFRVFTDANMALLCREYLIVALAAIGLGVLTRKFGWARETIKKIPLIRKYPVFSKLLHGLVLPRISEWHLALSPILLYKPAQYTIEIDAMTKAGALYRGAVYEKNIASDGSLQTIILSAPCRFLNAEFLKDCTEYEKLADKSLINKPAKADYWKKIPGEMFLLSGADITSVNVRHVGKTLAAVNPTEDTELIEILKTLNSTLNELKQVRR